MSGIMGGLRQSFEMLIRAHGGHTCNCTSEKASDRCTYKKGATVCPACLVFGCTGLARAFKLNMSIPKEAVHLPERDTAFRGKMGPPSIDTWLATMTKGGGTIGPKEHELARAEIKTWCLAYQPEPVATKLIAIRDVRVLATEEDPSGRAKLMRVMRYLLLFHSLFDGLGSKTQQGWGQYAILDPMSQEEQLEAVNAIKLLIASCETGNIQADGKHPRADDCFYAEWDLGQAEPELGLEFQKGIRLSPHYRCTGFALRFRLRRAIVDGEADSPPVAANWNKDVPPVRAKHSKELRRPGEKKVAQQLLFGRDGAGNDDKAAGLIGVSHCYKEDGTWRVRLVGRLPAVAQYRTTRGTIALPWNAAAIRTYIIDQFGPCIRKGVPQRVVTAEKWLQGLEETGQ